MKTTLMIMAATAVAFAAGLLVSCGPKETVKAPVAVPPVYEIGPAK